MAYDMQLINDMCNYATDRFRELEQYGFDFLKVHNQGCFYNFCAYADFLNEFSRVCPNNIDLSDPQRLREGLYHCYVGSLFSLQKSVYLVNADVIESLQNNSIDTNIPIEFFMRMADFCPYFVFENDTFDSDFPYKGMFITNSGVYEDYAELIIRCVASKTLSVFLRIGVRIVDGTLNFGTSGDTNEQKAILSLAIPLLLYYLSNNADIVPCTRETFSYKSNRKRVKLDNLVSAKSPTYFKVGDNIRKKLIQFKKEYKKSTVAFRRSHFRQGHWHGYWHGKKNSWSDFRLHWIAPCFVRASVVATGKDTEVE